MSGAKRRICALLFVVFGLGGCETLHPYASVSIGQYIDKPGFYDDVYPKCERPFLGTIGIEHDSGFIAHYTHQSNADCKGVAQAYYYGKYIELDEPFSDAVYVGWKFGGKR